MEGIRYNPKLITLLVCQLYLADRLYVTTRQKSHLGATLYVTTKFQIDQFYLSTGKTLQQRLKQVRLIDVLFATL